METPYPPCSIPTDWKELYRAAILETNENLIPEKVSAAEIGLQSWCPHRSATLRQIAGPAQEVSLCNEVPLPLPRCARPSHSGL
jgi:hypothetical protein